MGVGSFIKNTASGIWDATGGSVIKIVTAPFRIFTVGFMKAGADFWDSVSNIAMIIPAAPISAAVSGVASVIGGIFGRKSAGEIATGAAINMAVAFVPFGGILAKFKGIAGKVLETVGFKEFGAGMVKASEEALAKRAAENGGRTLVERGKAQYSKGKELYGAAKTEAKKVGGMNLVGATKYVGNRAKNEVVTQASKVTVNDAAKLMGKEILPSAAKQAAMVAGLQEISGIAAGDNTNQPQALDTPTMASAMPIQDPVAGIRPQVGGWSNYVQNRGFVPSAMVTGKPGAV